MKAVLDMASEKSDESERPTILFFDEVDGVLGETDSKQEAARAGVIKIFQMWMQGFECRKSSVIVVAATNHMEKLPQAVLSRFRVKSVNVNTSIWPCEYKTAVPLVVMWIVFVIIHWV